MTVAPLRWQSDWNGYEVGYPEVDVVGLYCSDGMCYYIDVLNNKVLEEWRDEDGNEDENYGKDS